MLEISGAETFFWEYHLGENLPGSEASDRKLEQRNGITGESKKEGVRTQKELLDPAIPEATGCSVK